MAYRLLRVVALTQLLVLGVVSIGANAGLPLRPSGVHEQDQALAQAPKPESEPSNRSLCELLLDAAPAIEQGADHEAEQRAMAATYLRRLGEHCALLARGPEDDAQDAEKAAPQLRVDGVAMRLIALDDPQWRQGFQQALAEARAAPRWHLDLYLAKTSTRDGSPSIDFSVCNLEQRRRFDGTFRLLLVEQQSVPAQQGHYWRVLREIVRAPIDDLAPAAVAGCPLPERFELPTSSEGLPLFIIAIVDSAVGRVQAVLTIPMNRDGAQP
ncbi:MAG: hypothetical protein C1943_04940 [Halochromatium sp.]|nr:hypothetical protein [Halochromatium sp.]